VEVGTQAARFVRAELLPEHARLETVLRLEKSLLRTAGCRKFAGEGCGTEHGMQTQNLKRGLTRQLVLFGRCAYFETDEVWLVFMVAAWVVRDAVV
jgi:hypothetical protein